MAPGVLLLLVVAAVPAADCWLAFCVFGADLPSLLLLLPPQIVLAAFLPDPDTGLPTLEVLMLPLAAVLAGKLLSNLRMGDAPCFSLCSISACNAAHTISHPLQGIVRP